MAIRDIILLLAEPWLLVIFLLQFNPGKYEFDKFLGNQQLLKTINKYIRKSFRTLVLGEQYRNLSIFSVINDGSKGYYYGVGGVWIDSDYWQTWPGRGLLFAVALVIYEIIFPRNRTIRRRHGLLSGVFVLLVFILISQTAMCVFSSDNSVVQGIGLSMGISIVLRKRNESRYISNAGFVSQGSAQFCALSILWEACGFLLVLLACTHQKWRNITWYGYEFDKAQAAICVIVLELCQGDWVALACSFAGLLYGIYVDGAKFI
jgi:hypothetical protein